MSYLLTIAIALFAIGAMAQGRNEYEKSRYVECLHFQQAKDQSNHHLML